MGFRVTNKIWLAAGLVAFGTVSCAIPFFSRSNTGGAVSSSSDKSFQPRPAKLSGVLTLKDECPAGYYQVRLQGLLDSAQIQVDAQTDQSGHFNLIAPPGQYMMLVEKGECGSKERITLEENTEHMLAVNVEAMKSIEKVGKIKGRLPASVLILPTR